MSRVVQQLGARNSGAVTTPRLEATRGDVNGSQKDESRAYFLERTNQ